MAFGIALLYYPPLLKYLKTTFALKVYTAFVAPPEQDEFGMHPSCYSSLTNDFLNCRGEMFIFFLNMRLK